MDRFNYRDVAIGNAIGVLITSKKIALPNSANFYTHIVGGDLFRNKE